MTHSNNRFLKVMPLASLGVSAAGLGVSTANFMNAKASRESLERQRKIESQSLNALKAIHTSISSEPGKKL